MAGWSSYTPPAERPTQPQTNNDGKIIIGPSATNSVGFDYGYYQTGSSNEGPNGTVKVGNIIINGNSNYGYR